jgi:hypothetical protein
MIAVLVVCGLASAGLTEAAKKATGPGTVFGIIEIACQPAGKVLVYLVGRSFVAYTDADGSFLLEGVPEGTHTLHVESGGLEHDQPVTVSAGTGTDVGAILLGPAPTSDPQNCGACGNVCAGGETCEGGTCTACQPDGTPCSTGVPGVCAIGEIQSCTCAQTVLPTTESCDGVDSDCDGVADETDVACLPGMACNPTLGCCAPPGVGSCPVP